MSAPLVVSSPPHYDIRLAANKHSNTVPDMTRVTVILNRLPTAVESIGKKRSVTGRGFGLRLAFSDRFFTAINANPLERRSGRIAACPRRFPAGLIPDHVAHHRRSSGSNP